MRLALSRRALVSLAALALAVAFAAGPLAAAPPVDYQEPPPDPPGAGTVKPLDPGFLQGSVPDRLSGVGNFQRLPAQDESGFITVAVRQEPYWKAGVLDPVLTNACRLGYFASVPLNRMLVRFEPQGGEGEAGRGALQYIPPDRRHLLVDTRNLARPNETYYFKDAAFPSCQVWVENPQGKRFLNAGGTSLASADPKARAKMKALVASWPQKPEPPPQ
jgi:hypothetical protein